MVLLAHHGSSLHFTLTSEAASCQCHEPVVSWGMKRAGCYSDPVKWNERLRDCDRGCHCGCRSPVSGDCSTIAL
jgi:hypothetical protein